MKSEACSNFPRVATDAKEVGLETELGAGPATPLTPALSPLRGEGDATQASILKDIDRRGSGVRSFGESVWARRGATELTDASAATPSPLNGERAGVRGVTVRVASVL